MPASTYRILLRQRFELPLRELSYLQQLLSRSVLQRRELFDYDYHRRPGVHRRLQLDLPILDWRLGANERRMQSELSVLRARRPMHRAMPALQHGMQSNNHNDVLPIMQWVLLLVLQRRLESNFRELSGQS
jgi:hypothetical protein